jgi:hypothetical protein
MQLRVRDVCHGQSMASRALTLQQKTSRPVQFEITEPARTAVLAWISHSNLKAEDFLSPAASTPRRTYRPASTRGSWIPGFFIWVWTQPTMAPIRYVGRRPR